MFLCFLCFSLNMDLKVQYDYHCSMGEQNISVCLNISDMFSIFKNLNSLKFSYVCLQRRCSVVELSCLDSEICVFLVKATVNRGSHSP